MERFVWVLPHSTESAALEATSNTLASLIHGGPLMKIDGCYVEKGGWYKVVALDPKFVAWASKRQGYVADAEVRP